MSGRFNEYRKYIFEYKVYDMEYVFAGMSLMIIGIANNRLKLYKGSIYSLFSRSDRMKEFDIKKAKEVERLLFIAGVVTVLFGLILELYSFLLP